MNRIQLNILFSCLIFMLSITSDLESQTFQDRRVINAQSVEMLANRKFDLRIAHRFGDMFGESGGWETFYGLENASDILIGGEYGISNNLNIGINRTKGSGPLNKFLNGYAKLRMMNQFGPRKPAVSIILLGVVSYSTMQNSANPEALSNFKQSSHRWVSTGQIIIGRKITDGLSLQVLGSFTHRNQVLEGDENDLLSIGVAGRIKLSRSYGFIFDVNAPVSSYRKSENDFYPSVGVGLEVDTGGGHVFQINLTNARGLSENDYIPYSRSNWNDGEFRLGFTISRLFNL
jgi:hypothetical protein